MIADSDEATRTPVEGSPAGETLLAEGTEKTAFAELSVRDVLDDPLTVEKLEQLLDSLKRAA